MNQDEVISLMESSRSEDDWNANCDKVKATNSGRYPAFWFEAVIVSGLAERICESWLKA